MERYSRQILFKFIGKQGQKKLLESTVCIIGVGALGSVCAELLARAGIRKLILIEGDVLDITNLHRQFLYDEKGLGKKKALLAKKRISEINSEIVVEAHPVYLSKDNLGLIGNPDLIIGSTDNTESRYLINEYSLKHKIPWTYGGAIAGKGTIINLLPGGPCMSCIMKKSMGDTSKTQGISNIASSIIGTLLANETMKILLGKQPEKDMLRIDILSNELTKIKISKDINCESCRKIR